MFPLWAAACLVVFGEAQARSVRDEVARTNSETIAPPAPQPDRAAPVEARVDIAREGAFWCLHAGTRRRVAIDDVVMLTAERDYVRLHTMQHNYLVRGRLKQWLQLLPTDRFTQVHRSAIVRLDAVTAVERVGSVLQLRLRNGQATLVSRTKGKDVRRWLSGRGGIAT